MFIDFGTVMSSSSSPVVDFCQDLRVSLVVICYLGLHLTRRYHQRCLSFGVRSSSRCAASDLCSGL
ncbi:hypothetical protein RHGRI_001582 [Rhododendron griersonianum]|uniref:Uncharacterized protein n=1 Tax=Rhododendron griersonianum TaxID=479676 RepID=A0AAV6LLJ4_9ERIC|nr:hypothetical protein RHGRI_001582 [Rhododendron griersonianum]